MFENQDFRGNVFDRRGFLAHMRTGLAGMALTSLLSRDGLLAGAAAAHRPYRPSIDPRHPHAVRPAHHSPQARSVLMIFMSGAFSHVDTFDFKPELIKHHGQQLPGADQVTNFFGSPGLLQKPYYGFRPRGTVGKMVSDLLPNLADLVDDFCFIHSLTAKTNNHAPAENFMSTGFTRAGFPSMGAWVNYALGTENENLPSFVALPDPRGLPQSTGNNWGAGFLPAVFQGTPLGATRPIRNLLPPESVSAQADAASRELLEFLNRRHGRRFPGDSELEARISSYQLAAQMQLSVPEIADLTTEPEHILRMYGADDATRPVAKRDFARNCVLARRLIEQGVRFVQLFNGANTAGEGENDWDGHTKLKEQYDRQGEVFDQPAAALIRDLKQRGLLEDTLVVFCTEFGRMPTLQQTASGRDHNPHGFTCWLAGAGVKAPFSYGSTDEFGFRATENIVEVYDFNATVLHLLGLDHEKLTYLHNGFERRLTDVHGHVLRDVLVS